VFGSYSLAPPTCCPRRVWQLKPRHHLRCCQPWRIISGCANGRRRIATSPKEPTISKALLKRLDSQPTLQQHRLRPALARHSAPGLSRMRCVNESSIPRCLSLNPC